MTQSCNAYLTSFMQYAFVTQTKESFMKTLVFIFTLLACIISSVANASSYPEGFIIDNAYISKDQAFIQTLKAKRNSQNDIHQFIRNDKEDAFERVAIEEYVKIPKKEHYTGK